MKIGLFTVSAPEYTPDQCVERLAALGYDGVEWRVIEDRGDRSTPSFWSGNRTSMSIEEVIERAPALRSTCAQHVLAMPTLGTYIDSRNLKIVEAACRAAVAVGASVIRVSPGGYAAEAGTWSSQLDAARRRYADVAGIAARFGVRACVETHMSQFSASAAGARSILEGLDPQHVGIMWDPANQIIEGAEPYPVALAACGEFLAEVHVKNLAWQRQADGKWVAAQCPVAQGVVDWPAVLMELRRVHYDGWLVFEDFSTEIPIEERLRSNFNWLKGLISQ